MINESFLIPAPRTEAPLDAPVLGWGIIGPGRIATAFAESLAAHTRQRIVAIGSRSADTALNFAKRFDGCDAVRSYEELVKHAGIDIVYVSTPHSFHHQCVMLALEAGKHVLVEKPFAINAQQATEMAQTAQQKGLFLMEAMWPRFLPAFDSVRQILSEGILGEITSVVADLGEYFRPDPANRLFSPDLAGGALLRSRPRAAGAPPRQSPAGRAATGTGAGIDGAYSPPPTETPPQNGRGSDR